MSDEAGPAQPAAQPNSNLQDRPYQVDVTRARGVLVGDGSTQHNYFQFFAGTWTDGVAPRPLVAASGQVDSPYRGLEAFRETDADFFFGRDAAISEVLSRLAGSTAGTGLLDLQSRLQPGRRNPGDRRRRRRRPAVERQLPDPGQRAGRTVRPHPPDPVSVRLDDDEPRAAGRGVLSAGLCRPRLTVCSSRVSRPGGRAGPSGLVRKVRAPHGRVVDNIDPG